MVSGEIAADDPGARREQQVREVVWTGTLKRVPASQVLELPDEDAACSLRRQITDAYLAERPILLCGKCGHPVFLAKNWSGKGFHFKHYSGAPPTCEWYTGEPRSPQAVGGAIHDGSQEGPLHRALKYKIAAILEADPEVTEVDVQSYVPGEDTRGRFPDVRAVRKGKSLVFEIQLATIQVPTLSARTTFYRQHGMHLIWVLWEFDPHNIRRISIRDTYVPNRRNAFSVDYQSLEESERRGTLLLRVFWPQPRAENGQIIEEWQSKLVTLDDLQYPDDFSPFFADPVALRRALFALAPEHRQAFKEYWINNVKRHWNLQWLLRLYERISDRANLGIPEDALKWMARASELRHIFNLLFSLEDDHVVGSSDHRFVINLLNNVLVAARPTWLWPVIDAALRTYAGRERLNREWVHERLRRSREHFNFPSEEMVAAFTLISAVFPDLDMWPETPKLPQG